MRAQITFSLYRTPEGPFSCCAVAWQVQAALFRNRRNSSCCLLLRPADPRRDIAPPKTTNPPTNTPNPQILAYHFCINPGVCHMTHKTCYEVKHGHGVIMSHSAKNWPKLETRQHEHPSW